MSAITLPGRMHEAYMAGKYSVDVEHYTRLARSTTSPTERCQWMYCARHANRRMVDYLRRARGAQ